MAREKLGGLRKLLYERYEKRSEKVKNYSQHDLIAGRFERLIMKMLTEFGIDYPVDFDRPPPDVYVPARQGTFTLDQQGSTDGYSPPVPTDQICFTWRARDGGFLVVDSLDFIMEDPIAESCFTIEYKFDEQVNTAVYQRDNSVPEPGHWKFNRVVLVDGEVMTVCVKNTCPYASGVFSMESKQWSL